MGDRTYGTLRILSGPEPFTDDDAERLALLETVFDAAGGRGVEVADELDRLRIRSNTGLNEYLENLGWSTSDDDTPLAERTYNQDEVSCGYVSGDNDGLLAHLAVLGCGFVIWEDPKFEWLGTVVMHTPDLGFFEASCDAEGNPVLSPQTIVHLVETTPTDRLGDVLLQAVGHNWAVAFGWDDHRPRTDVPYPVALVVVVRDPDASNEFYVFDGAADIHDIDLGYMALEDPEEFAEWAAGQLDATADLAAAHPSAAAFIRDHVEQVRDRYDHDTTPR